MKKEWTEAEITTMRILSEAGKTARHIGAVLHRSRNSIIGKMNRIGAAAGEPKPAKVAVVALVPPAKAAGCQFPMGKYPYHSCGEKTTPGASTSVYCEEHYKTCYRQRLGDSDKFKVEGRIYPRPLVGWGSHMTSVL